MTTSTASSPVNRHALDTPCLIVDLDVLDRNVATLAAYFRERQVAWRPHAKSYKCGRLARRVVEGGACGVTCAKLGEAEVMAAAGIRDLLITGPVVGASKVARLAQLRRTADPIAVVDHPDHVRQLSAGATQAGVTLRIMIEVDLGMKRCGVAPGEAVVELGRLIARTPGVELAGIMGWEGHLLTLADRQEKIDKIRAAMLDLAASRAALEAAGVPCPIVSAGGSGSFQVTAGLGVATEIQAGGAVFMDLFYRNKCHVEGLDYALTVLATVISRPTPQRAVIDAGRKAMNPELHLPMVVGRDDLKVNWLSAEHGVLDVLHGPGPAIGDRIELVPGYGDLTTFLHDRYQICRGPAWEASWELDARGASS